MTMLLLNVRKKKYWCVVVPAANWNKRANTWYVWSHVAVKYLEEIPGQFKYIYDALVKKRWKKKE